MSRCVYELGSYRRMLTGIVTDAPPGRMLVVWMRLALG